MSNFEFHKKGSSFSDSAQSKPQLHIIFGLKFDRVATLFGNQIPGQFQDIPGHCHEFSRTFMPVP